jgi:hypothetical protein
LLALACYFKVISSNLKIFSVISENAKPPNNDLPMVSVVEDQNRLSAF